MDISSVVQPFEHTIKRYPIQSALTLKPLLNFMMAHGPLLLEEHGKNLDAAGSNPLRPAPDHLFRLLVKIGKHNDRVITIELQQSCIILAGSYIGNRSGQHKTNGASEAERGKIRSGFYSISFVSLLVLKIMFSEIRNVIGKCPQSI